MIDRPVGLNELQEMVKDKSFVFIVSMMQPRRIGAHLFNVKLEYEHFTPMTERNNDYIAIEMTWPEVPKADRMKWWVARIPAKDMPLAQKVATESPIPMRIADGIPHIISKTGVQSFPLNGPNVFSLEYATTNLSEAELGKQEDEEIAKLWEKQKKWLIANGHADLAHDGDHSEQVLGNPALLLIIENFKPDNINPSKDDIKAILLGDINRALKVHRAYFDATENPTIDGLLTAFGHAGGFRRPTAEESQDPKYAIYPLPWTERHWASLNTKQKRI